MKKLKTFIYKDSAKVRERIFVVTALVSGMLLAISFAVRLLLILSVPLFLLTIVYGRLAFRCPHCDAFLGTRMAVDSYCAQCGKRIV